MNKIKSLEEWNKKSTGEWIRLYLRSGWTFESVWEKLVLIGLCVLGVWKIAGWIW